MIALGTLALGLWGRGLTAVQVQPVYAGVCWLTCTVSAGACFLRGREAPRERSGWHLVGWSLLLQSVANALMALLPAFPGLGAFRNGWLLLSAFLSLGLIVTALVVWPWRRSRTEYRFQHALGSALFVGSLLVVLEALGTWVQGFQTSQPIHAALLYNAFRLSVLGGMGLYLVGQNPGRIRGVLGLVLANALLGGLYVAVLQMLLERGFTGLVPLASVSALVPMLLGLAAWSRAPVESPALASDHGHTWDILPYGPFLVAGGAVLATQHHHGNPGLGPLVGFMGLTAILVLRQFLLLREVKRSNASLEERVEVRTQDLRAVQATLLRMERMNTVAILGAGLTHDLNNLMTVVGTSAEQLELDLPPEAMPERRALERMLMASRQAGSLTGRLMAFARRDVAPLQRLFLAEELAHLEDLVRLLLPRTVALHLDLAPGRFPVLTLRTHLEQILVNLVANARDAMPGGGTITVRLDEMPGPSGPQARIQVTDTGTGLPEGVLEHLFEPFFTTKEEGKGTGLGLASVKAMVEGDGGTVAVLNTPGKGCTFVVLYPMTAQG
jgi:signal transduction histidine kinase